MGTTRFTMRSRSLWSWSALALLLSLLCMVDGADTEPQKVDVIILGAGITGVAAAAKLYELNVSNFVVLEASDRVGGRMKHATFANYTIELGANWIEGMELDINPIWGLAQEIKLKGHTTNQEYDREKPVLYGPNGRLGAEEAQKTYDQVDQVFEDVWNITCERQRAGLPDISLRDAMLQAGWPSPSNLTGLQRALEYFLVDWDFEFPPEQVSLYNYGEEPCPPVRSQGQPTPNQRKREKKQMGRSWKRKAAKGRALSGAPPPPVADDKDPPRYFVTDQRGYSTVVDYIVSGFAGNRSTGATGANRVVTNSEVVKIEAAGKGEGVVVTTTSGKQYVGRYALCTFSAGVVNHHIEQGTLFTPALPSNKQKAFSQVQMGIYTKIFFEFRTQFWDDEDFIVWGGDGIDSAAPQSKRGYYTIWQNLEARGQFFPDRANMLMATVVTDISQEVESQSLNKTIADAMGVLRQMYGNELPEPEQVTFYAWGKDPLTLGSFSNLLTVEEEDFESMAAPFNGLYFAGEAIQATYNGYVEGGYMSGQKAAENIAEALRQDQHLRRKGKLDKGVVVETEKVSLE